MDLISTIYVNNSCRQHRLTALIAAVLGAAFVFPAGAAHAGQTINTNSTTSCGAQGGTVSGGNLLTDFDNGTFGFANGQPNQSPSTNPYPGQIQGGIFANFYSFFHGAYGYVANPVQPRNNFQHANITDPVYGTTGRFFASDPNTNTPVINFTALGVIPNQNYEVSFWAANSEPNGAPNNINLEIDGIISLNTGPLQAFQAALEWKKYSYVFNAGNRDTVIFALRSLETGAGGRDFYMDNVELRRCTVSGRTLGGNIYSDVNRDNAFQPTREDVYTGINVSLYDTRGDTNPTNDLFISQTTSIVGGNYSFINVPANPNYQLRVQSGTTGIPSGGVLGTPSIINIPTTNGDSFGHNFGYDLPRPVLNIVKSSALTDNNSSGLFATPGQDINYSLLVTNAGGEGADKDSLLLIDQLPQQLIFYNADYDGTGNETNDPMVFTQINANLNFSYARDIRFANGPSAPVNLADCSYLPATGYDPNVRFICINPKGVMRGGSGTHSFTVKLRTRIK